ncbi:hypothetical protein HQ587_07800 [bacterium]|nr:hypothetical protein [bacterium]
MLENIRRHFVSWAMQLSARRSKINEFSLKDCWSEVNNCLICWPSEGMDITAADIVLSRLQERFPDAALTVLALPGVGASMPSGINAKIIQMNKKSLSVLGLPTKRMRDEVVDIRADVAVDISAEYNPLSAYLCQISRARVSVAFADSRGDLAYNFQVAPRPERQGLDRYRALARYIG